MSPKAATHYGGRDNRCEVEGGVEGEIEGEGEGEGEDGAEG